MSSIKKQFIISLSVDSKYLCKGIDNSFTAEKSGISLAELYQLKTDQENNSRFRKNVLQVIAPGTHKILR